MGKGTNTTTTQQSTSATPQAMAAYNQALGYAQNAYNQTSGQPVPGLNVAPVNAQQNLGISGINNYANFAQPAINQSLGLLGNAAQPLTQGQIQNYYNPYQQNVINATEAQFNNQNAQQQQQVLGNAAMQGALGNDRVGVAQANLAGQQQIAEAPVIAGLEQSGYNQALQTAAQQYQQNPLMAAYGLTSAAAAGQNAGLTGANAQIGAGNLQQQTSQAQNTADYQRMMQQFYLPEQLAQAYAGQAGSLGPLYGSTGTGQTTAPAPSIFSQLAGLGIAGVGAVGGTGGFGQNGWLGKMFSKDGGRIKRYDAGGSAGISSSNFDLPGLTPLHPAHMAALPPPDKPADPNIGMKPITDALGSLRWNNNSTAAQSPQPYRGVYSTGTPGGTAGILYTPQNGGLYERGGRIRRDMGGPLTQAGYGTGSFVPSFEDRWAGVNDDPHVVYSAAPPPAPKADFYLNEDETRGLGLGQSVNWTPDQNAAVARYAAQGAAAPQRSASMVPPSAGVDDGQLPENATLTAGNSDYGLSAPRQAGTWDAGGAGWTGLMAAGLGIMASRSPFPGVAIGEGGLHGLQAFSQERQQEQQQRTAEANIEAQRKRLELMAKQELDRYSKMTPYEAQHMSLMQQQEKRAEAQGQTLSDRWGNQYRVTRDPNDPTKGWVTGINPTTGQVETKPIDQSTAAAPSGTPQYVPPAIRAQNAGLSEDALLPANSQPVEDTSGRNEEVLKTLPADTAAVIKGLADYEINPVTVQARRRDLILGLVKQYDGNYDQALYPAIAAKKKEFMAGGPSSPAGQMTAGRMAINHAAEMSDAAEKLKASPGLLNGIASAGIPFLSYGAAALNNRSVVGTGTPESQALSELATARNHFAEEVTKFYAGSAGSEAERDRALSNLDAAKSLPELRAAIHQEAKLMQDKINGLQTRWKTDLGGSYQNVLRRAIPDFPILDEQSKGSMAKIAQRYNMGAAAAPAAPKYQPGQVVTTAKGRFRRNDANTGWDPVQ